VPQAGNHNRPLWNTYSGDSIHIEKSIVYVGCGTICGFSHLLRVLGHIPCGSGENYHCYGVDFNCVKDSLVKDLVVRLWYYWELVEPEEIKAGRN
jgi:hypothetical protein